MEKISKEILKEKFIIDFSMIDWKQLRLHGNETLKLLLIDDERNFSEVLFDAFDSQDYYEIDMAENGLEGLELYKSVHHDLVISDIMMPKMSGIVLGEHIKTIDPKQKIFFISGWVQENQLFV